MRIAFTNWRADRTGSSRRSFTRDDLRGLAIWGRSRPLVWRLAASAITIGVAVAIRYAMADYVPASMRYNPLYVFIILVALLLGPAAAAFSTLLGTFLVHRFIAPLLVIADFAQAAVFLFGSAILIWVIDALYHAQAEVDRIGQALLNEQQFRHFVEQTPAAMAMFDTDMRYIAASSRWMSDYGLAGKSVAGRSHYDLFPHIPDRWRYVHLRGLAGEVVKAEKDPFVRPDGTTQWLNWEVKPWYLDEGEIGGIIIHADDVTERLRIEEALHESEHLNSQILQALPAHVAVIGENGVVLAANEAWRGYAEEHNDCALPGVAVGANYLDICRQASTADSDAANAVAGIEALLSRTSSSFSLEYPCHAPDEQRWFLLTAVPFGEHAPRGAVIAHLDITKRKQVEDELSRTSELRAVGQLAGGIAHDFGNLLTVISGNLQLAAMYLEDGHLEDGGTDAQAAQTYLIRALEAAERGASFNRRLVLLAGKRPTHPKPVNVNLSVDETVRMLRRTLGETIAIKRQLASDLWPVCIDPGEVESAVLNLALNARDAMPTGGDLMISTRNATLDAVAATAAGAPEPGDYVVLTVQDSGLGMPPDVLNQAVLPFFTTKGPGKSAGLGLTSVTRTLEAAGGSLAIASTPGEGTIVSLFLPRSAAPLKPCSAPEQQHAVPRGAGELILVVEDDVQVRDVVRNRVESLGYVVRTAATAREAMAVLQSNPAIQLVLSDVIMPGGMSGYDLAAWLEVEKPHIAVLLTSGYSAPDDTTMEGAAHLVLAKPYSLAQLATAIQRTLHPDNGQNLVMKPQSELAS